jgi:octaprenyl-diphosphate synthase
MPVHKIKRPAKSRDKANSMQNLFAPIAEQLEEVRCRISERLTTQFISVNQQIESIGAGRGKLFRPAMLLLSGQATGSLRDEHTELAMMVELVHTATLLHDDVIDQAEMRRNCQAVNCLWGNTAAVLLGDFLLSHAFSAGAKVNVSGADAIISEAAEQICQGELIQNIRQGDWAMDEQDYMSIIASKTASLFAASCRLGALASDADTAMQDTVESYGRNLGLTFQITDDILDITGDDKKIGKTLGTDFMQRKLTLPAIHYLGRKKAGQRKDCFEKMAKLDRTQLIETLKQSGSLDYAGSVAQTCSKQAAKAISRIKPGIAKDAMKKIAAVVAARA